MAIKPPVKTIEEAFNNSCKKNGISIRKKKENKNSMRIKDENGDVFILSDNLSIKKEAPLKPVQKKKRTRLIRPVEVLSLPTPNAGSNAGKAGKKRSKAKELIKI